MTSLPHVDPPVETPSVARRLPRRAWGLVLGAVLMALVTRAPGLGSPDVLVFDEAYYADQALDVARTGVSGTHAVHPTVGPWMIAVGIRTFGFTAWGWRVGALVAGAALAGLTVAGAFRVTRSHGLSALAGLLVVTDGVAFTTGRLALLDGFFALWATAALVLLLHAASRPLDAPLHRRATWGTAVLLGLACATKWSGVPLVVVSFAVLVLLSRRACPPGRDRRDAVARSFAVLVLVPAAIAAVSLLPTVLRYPDSGAARSVCEGVERCDTSLLGRVTGVLEDQVDLVRFHRSLDPQNRFASSAAWWAVQGRSTGLLLSRCPSADPVCRPGDGDVARRIVAVGNPLVWAAGFAAVVVQVWLAVRRRDVLAATLVLWAGALWLPWVFGGRAGYSFYGVVLVPALAIALVRTIGSWRAGARGTAVVVLTVVAITGAVALHPVWTARPTSPSYLSWLLPGRPPGAVPADQSSGS